MRSTRRERSSKEETKTIFVPPSKKVPKKLLDEIVPVEFPGIAVTLKHFENQPPSAAPKEAIGITHTYQEDMIGTLNRINPQLISNKRTSRKDPEGSRRYGVPELRELAAKFGLKASRKKKIELAAAVGEKYKQYGPDKKDGIEN